MFKAFTKRRDELSVIKDFMIRTHLSNINLDLQYKPIFANIQNKKVYCKYTNEKVQCYKISFLTKHCKKSIVLYKNNKKIH